MASAKRKSRSSGSSKSASRSNKGKRFVICVKNDDYAASLELRKIYQVLPDAIAGEHGRVRVIDESGEDYLFPREYFVAVNLPRTAERAVLRARTD